MVGPRAYPPGLPLTLAPIVAFAGVDSPLFRLLMLVSAVVFAYLAYRRLGRDIAPWQAAIAGAFAAFVVEVRYGTLMPLSDIGLCALIWGTMLAVDSAREWSWQRIALVTALGFAAIAYRVAGVALVPALVLYALVNWSRHRGRALLPVAIWAGTGFAALGLGIVEVPFAGFLLPRVSEIGDRVRQAMSVYPVASLSAQLYPLPGDRPNDVYHVVASVLMVGGVVALLWRVRRTMLSAVALTYAALLLASPAFSERYLWPLLPLLTAGFVIGLSALWRAVATRLGRPTRAPLFAAAILALIIVSALVRVLNVPPLPSEHHDPDRMALFDWLRGTNAREPIRVMYSNPRVLTLETRVPAMPALFAKPEVHLAALYDRRITHAIMPVATPSDCRARLAHELLTLFPDHFALAYANQRYRVYRLVRPGVPIPPVEGYRPSWGGNRCNPSRPDLQREERR
jgi:hypothetical protein